MTGDRTFLPSLGRYVKRASVVRRLPPSTPVSWQPAPAGEGDVAVFEVPTDAPPVVVESVTGRFMTLAAGDLLLAVPGHRESTRWVVGRVPEGGLQPGGEYWLLADSGLVGELEGASVLPKAHLGRVRLLGVLPGPGGRALNLRGMAPLAAEEAGPDQDAPVTALLGTSSEVGKTTAGLAVLQTLLSPGQQGRPGGGRGVAVLKATGTASVQETARYADYGARHAFDCVDFGLPTTYPSGRPGIAAVFDRAIANVLALEADAVLVEFGGDLFGANVPDALDALRRRRPAMRVVLAASDAAAALGSQAVLDGMGLAVDLFTGPCTDTPTLRARTERLTGRPAMNMLGGGAPAPVSP